MHSGLGVILQASCVKCGQIFTSEHHFMCKPEVGKMDGQLGCSSWRNVYKWWLDMVELRTGTYGCPWHAKANVHRHCQSFLKIN